MRFRLTGSAADLNAAVEVRREALRLLPDDHLDRATALNNLADVLKNTLLSASRIQLGDLKEAEQLVEEACSRAPVSDIQRHECLKNLADIISVRFWAEGGWERSSLTIAINACEECINSRLTSPDDVIWSALCAARLVKAASLYEEKDLLKRLSRMLTTATELLPTLNPRTADRNDQQYTISKCGWTCQSRCSIFRSCRR